MGVMSRSNSTSGAMPSAVAIDVPNAMVPPGTYVIEVAVSDAGGRQSVANIEIDAK